MGRGIGLNAASHIAVVEDEVIQRELLVAFLSGAGLRVSAFETAEGVRELLERELPDLVLLDVRLPGEDGYSLARHVRSRGPRVGIIMVSAAGQTIDQVQGLEAGADDYVTKPFEPRELLARVRSVLRRVRPVAAEAELRVAMGRRVLDLARRSLLTGAGEVETLTDDEFTLLRAFAANPNRPLERGWLAEVTYGDQGRRSGRAIDRLVAKLRRKIEVDPAHPRAIRTVRGVGYMFVPDVA